MKLFLKRITLFFAPIMLVLLLGEYAVRSLPNSYKLKGDFLKKSTTTIETLILGSSHTFYGINPKYFTSKTFNAANVSQSPDVDLAILESYQSQLTNLSHVVIRLSYDTLFEQLKNSSEDWRLKDYRLYTDIDFDYNLKHNSEILSLGTREVLKILKDEYIDNEPLLNCDSLGWGNDLSNKPQPDLDEVGVIVAKKHTIDSWELLDDNVQIFNQLMQWCGNRNIQVILVTPPGYKSYTSNHDQKQLEKMIEVGEVLDAEYTNCKYYNFLTDSIFKSNDFYDGDHLNASGAQKFSLLINNIIEN